MANAFIMRMKTWDDTRDGLFSRIPQAIHDHDLILGFSSADNLIGEVDWNKFRQRLRLAYPHLQNNNHRLGNAAGNLWRFIHDMAIGDYAVIPDSGQFYVGKVKGPARYEVNHTDDDTAHRRSVEWQNNEQPIPRGHASARLQSRMKAYQTIVWANEFTEEIEALLRHGGQEVPTVGDEIAQAVREALRRQLQEGRMNDRLFERFVAALMRKIGCNEVRIVSRNVDKGADIVAIHSGLNVTLAIQVKFHNDCRGQTDSRCIEQLAAGMDKESADLGWAVTLSSFDENAQEIAEKLRSERNLLIRLIDGDELVKMAVEHGLPTQFANI
jgi:predicted Mrr-cat superfamily restriction endonuclease